MQFYAEGGTITKRHPVTNRFAEGASGNFDKLSVDDVVWIDHSSHVGNEDKSHLLLKGDLPLGDHYVRVKNSAGTLLNINHVGKLHAYAGISSPEITHLTTVLTANVIKTEDNEEGVDALNASIGTVGTDLAALEIAVNNAAPATSSAVENSLVKRDNVNGTVFTLLEADIISSDNAVLLVKDGQLLFKPYHVVNGINVPKHGWSFRFGRSDDQADISDNTQDGLEFISPSTNEIRIQVNEASPTIETVNNKYQGVWVRHRNAARVSQYEVNQYGEKTRVHWTVPISLTPGIAATKDFSVGVNDFNITLAAAWVFGNVPEVEIILSKTEIHPYQVYAFCFLDTVGANVQSRVYIKRETHLVESIAVPSELRYILAAEPRAGELQFAAGTKIVLRVRVQMLIH